MEQETEKSVERLTLPPIVMGNVRFMHNMEEFETLVGGQKVCWDSSVMCVTEMSLKDYMPENSSISGFLCDPAVQNRQKVFRIGLSKYEKNNLIISGAGMDSVFTISVNSINMPLRCSGENALMLHPEGVMCWESGVLPGYSEPTVCPANGQLLLEQQAQYKTHQFSKQRGKSKTFYPLVFNDIMGLEDGTDRGVHPDDIKLAMAGHVREGHKFNPVIPLSKQDQDYNPNPGADDKVHVLVCVLSANAPEIKDSVLKKMSSVRQTASDMGIPQLLIITKIDEACPETEKDLKNVYKSKHLMKKMKDFSSAVGTPMNCTFPVKNYSHEIDMNEDVDTLILSALKKIIDFGDDFIENV